MLRFGFALTVFFILSLSGFAQHKNGRLDELPSQPGPHIEKIKSLGDNEWLKLGAPAADPKWGKARGSSWGAKAMILAADKRGAFLFGEGVHAFVKPDGHIMDDLWFYDINSHAWICLYPGTDTTTFTQRVKDKQLVIAEDGQLIDGDKQPIPLHTLVHAWSYLTYDSDRKKFAFLSWNGNGSQIPRYFLGGEKQMDVGLKLLEEQLRDKKKAVFSPWFYDVARGKFERSLANISTPINAGGFPQFHYIPAKKQFFAVGSDTVTIFDPAKNQWIDAKPKGPAPKGYDACGCYDSKRNRVYRNDGDGSKGEGLMAYDIESNTWSHLKPSGKAPGASNTNAAFYEYDARLDIVVAIHFRGATTGIFVYDPKSNSWADPIPFSANSPSKFQFAANTFYDMELNAYFCHVAGDSRDNGVMWVYRYQK
ncbi:hypothetical protein KIH39_02095 [Telmatocola sphagniphila]|uniref:Uncharacterized protein n=1 Tax=Telmatocola sphagniphila TaxID=1123043 RepID=A0A8E6ETR0_9BACT|nr:hypothetical protein [Telmatocola sphagniphila]QVL32734.1 hypothetical protein KIH39_02095 [Telmatocola sphagniphila]